MVVGGDKVVTEFQLSYRFFSAPCGQIWECEDIVLSLTLSFFNAHLRHFWLWLVVTGYLSHFKILSWVGDSVQSSVLADLAATPQWTSTIFTRMDSSQSSLRDWM